jgi:hypothetical protein
MQIGALNAPPLIVDMALKVTKERLKLGEVRSENAQSLTYWHYLF